MRWGSVRGMVCWITYHSTIISGTAGMSLRARSAATTHEMVSGSALGSVNKIKLGDRLGGRIWQSESRANRHGKCSDGGKECLELHFC